MQFPFHPNLGIIGERKSLPLPGHYGHQDTGRLETFHLIGTPLSYNVSCIIFHILSCSSSSTLTALCFRLFHTEYTKHGTKGKIHC